jgi:hypothetical protein
MYTFTTALIHISEEHVIYLRNSTFLCLKFNLKRVSQEHNGLTVLYD